jgi:hypothetical protein
MKQMSLKLTDAAIAAKDKLCKTTQLRPGIIVSLALEYYVSHYKDDSEMREAKTLLQQKKDRVKIQEATIKALRIEVRELEMKIRGGAAPKPRSKGGQSAKKEEKIIS